MESPMSSGQKKLIWHSIFLLDDVSWMVHLEFFLLLGDRTFPMKYSCILLSVILNFEHLMISIIKCKFYLLSNLESTKRRCIGFYKDCICLIASIIKCIPNLYLVARCQLKYTISSVLERILCRTLCKFI